MLQYNLDKLERDKNEKKYPVIGSVATFVNNINRMYKSFDDSIDLFQIYYRGHASKSFVEVPSIYREDDKGSPWVGKEENLCDEIIRECPNDFDNNSSVFDKLVKMQHYELPTRLLDITENPLVALYFACLNVENSKDNGEVLIYFVPKEEIYTHTNPQVEALSCISFTSTTNFKQANDSKGIKELVTEMRIHAAHLPYISSARDFDKTVCVRAKKSNPRIIRQLGAFFLFGAKDGDKLKVSDLPYKPFRMEVSNSQKKQILRELERYGISEKSLFPEIDKVAHHLKTH